MVKWQGFQHGINLGGWLSQCPHTKERYDTFITEKDIEKIASMGLDHIRVPVDYDLVETREGVYKEDGFGYIQKAIDWSRKNHLNMVLDLHKTYGYSFDSGEKEDGFFGNPDYQERFCRLWEEFSRRFGAYQDTLAFELLNEVTDKSYSDAWNRISGECIRRIRAILPEVTILVGGYWNNSIDSLGDLEWPADKNIIYNFHCYDPLLFTHQGAPWVKGMDTSFRLPLDTPVSRLAQLTEEFNGHPAPDFDSLAQDKPLGADYFEHRFARAVKVAEERNVRLYCGEYGVIDLATPEDTLRWYRAIHEAFEKAGIGRAAWSYREMNFSLTDERLAPVREELYSLL